MAKTRKTTEVAAAPAPQPVKEFYSAGKYTTVDDNGRVNHNMSTLFGVSAARAAKRSAHMAGIFADGDLGGANIADSNNIGYYSYQFPVDAMEMPASRAEELEFYRLAISRDPIVSRAIDMLCELPLSKMRLEKPKCSVDSFSDYVFDYFQRLMNDTRLFSTIIKATREYNVIGEAFMFVEQPENYMELTLCKAAAEALKKGRGFQSGVSPLTEAENAPMVGQERGILPDFITQRRKKTSKVAKLKVRNLAEKLAEVGEQFKENADPDEVHQEIIGHKAKLARLTSEHEARKVVIRMLAEQVVKETLERKAAAVGALSKTAAPGDGAPPPDAAAPADAPAPDAGAGGGEVPEGGDPSIDDGGGDMGMDAGMPMGGGGGGGMGGGPSIPGDMVDAASSAIQTADDAKRAREISELQRYIHLLERKKDLLEELEELAEKRKQEEEIFSHVVNEDFEGFERIQIMQPERITLNNAGGGEARVTYKPSEEEKAEYLNDPEVNAEVKDEIESEGVTTLNRNPFAGSYVIHFPRKQSGYEEHGRSVLQACIRSIIYREKLRQVQTTLASRNMTPVNLITAPGVSEVQVAQLRANIDEAIASPDFSIVTNYEVTWNRLDSGSRLLSLNDEWQHTNSNLAIGLGFSPEILIGEGMYGGNRVLLQLMENTFVQFREELSDILENQLFKPIAMLRGFYEVDNYGKPRWIYPKISFGAMCLVDKSDTYEQLFNLYSKGSLPVEVLYETLGLDSDTVSAQLEDALFSVRDSKYNELLSSLYGSLGPALAEKTDIIKRIAKGMNLNEEMPDTNNLEGSGEGV
jgi:hypothetical protein